MKQLKENDKQAFSKDALSRLVTGKTAVYQTSFVSRARSKSDVGCQTSKHENDAGVGRHQNRRQPKGQKQSRLDGPQAEFPYAVMSCIQCSFLCSIISSRWWPRIIWGFKCAKERKRCLCPRFVAPAHSGYRVISSVHLSKSEVICVESKDGTCFAFLVPKYGAVPHGRPGPNQVSSSKISSSAWWDSARASRYFTFIPFESSLNFLFSSKAKCLMYF